MTGVINDSYIIDCEFHLRDVILLKKRIYWYNTGRQYIINS